MPMQNATGSKIISVLSNHGCGGRRTEYALKRKDDTCPPANIVPTLLSLPHIGCEIALQDQRAEIIAEQVAHRELALLCVVWNRRAHISGIVTDPSYLPFAEFLARRQINVDEI